MEEGMKDVAAWLLDHLRVWPVFLTLGLITIGLAWFDRVYAVTGV